MNKAILIFQILVSCGLIVLILLQPKGTGMDNSLNSGGLSSKRGVDKLIFIVTIVFAILFLLGAILNILISLG